MADLEQGQVASVTKLPYIWSWASGRLAETVRKKHINETSNASRLEYPEGFAVVWDEHGLSIEVLDYHARTLRLPWETILDLARRARPEVLGGAAQAPDTQQK